MRSLIIRFSILFGLFFPALASAVTVVEFYNTNLDNYFITADANEAAAIDGGSAGPGWSRTSYTFTSGGSTPVCRFYGSQSPGPNSHFYTVDSAECQGLKDQQIPAGDPRKLTDKSWNFESLDFVSTPATNQTCPTGTTPVYRAYNNGFARGIDSNHRITSSAVAIQEVVNRGWSNEGVVMCAPSTPVGTASTLMVNHNYTGGNGTAMILDFTMSNAGILDVSSVGTNVSIYDPSLTLLQKTSEREVQFNLNAGAYKIKFHFQSSNPMHAAAYSPTLLDPINLPVLQNRTYPTPVTKSDYFILKMPRDGNIDFSITGSSVTIYDLAMKKKHVLNGNTDPIPLLAGNYIVKFLFASSNAMSITVYSPVLD
jgi:hypothetical protein